MNFGGRDEPPLPLPAATSGGFLMCAFAWGRFPFLTQPNKESAEGSAVPQRPDPQEADPVNHPDSVRDEPRITSLMDRREAERQSIPDQVEIAEMADRGRGAEAAMWKTIVAIGSEGLPIEDAPVTSCSLTHEEANAAAVDLMDAGDATRAAAKRVPLQGHLAVHRYLNNALNELDKAAAELAKAWPR